MRHHQQHQQPLDGPADYPVNDKRDQTGLLTKIVPNSLKNSSIYRLFLRATRVLQFLSAFISLVVFSQRLYKVYRLVNSIKTRRGVNGSYGAVEGILAAATLYTLISMLLGCIKKSANPGGKAMRWAWVVLDILFVAAFIAVTVITRPNGGIAGARHCYSPSRLQNSNGSDTATGSTANAQDDSCNLPWGTFLLAILSTFLHAITAAFHEVKSHRNNAKRVKNSHNKHNNDHEMGDPYQQQQYHQGGAPAMHNSNHY